MDGPYRSGPATNQARCPRCPGIALARRGLGHVSVDECPRCEGVFVARKVLEAILEDLALFEEVRAVYPAAAVAHPAVTYVRCPRCAEVMNRRMFAPGARVVVDVCRGHGTWFDAAELRAVVDFVELRGVSPEEQRAYESRQAARAEAAYLAYRYRQAHQADERPLWSRLLAALLRLAR